MAETQNVITKVSTHNKLHYGEQVHMYTVVTGKGSNRTSVTKHMTERQAKVLKDELKAEMKEVWNV